MILTKQMITQEAGEDWTQSNKTNESWWSLCVTPTGRIIAGGDYAGIWYSDNNGISWTRSNKTDGTWKSLCITSTGRIITGGNGNGIWYSDNNGISWTRSNKTNKG